MIRSTKLQHNSLGHSGKLKKKGISFLGGVTELNQKDILLIIQKGLPGGPMPTTTSGIHLCFHVQQERFLKITSTKKKKKIGRIVEHPKPPRNDCLHHLSMWGPSRSVLAAPLRHLSFRCVVIPLLNSQVLVTPPLPFCSSSPSESNFFLQLKTFGLQQHSSFSCCCSFQGQTHVIWKFPGQGSNLELELLAYTTAIATRDMSCICDSYHSSRQH